jgi:hypothetical protein
MNLSGLGNLGKVAGIGGISIGAMVLLFNALIGTIPGLPADQQADIVKLLAILCFGIGVLGIIAWFVGGGRHSQPSISVTADHGGTAVGRDSYVNTAPPRNRKKR